MSELEATATNCFSLCDKQMSSQERYRTHSRTYTIKTLSSPGGVRPSCDDKRMAFSVQQDKPVTTGRTQEDNIAEETLSLWSDAKLG